MRRFLLMGFLGLSFSPLLFSQIVIPANPGKFKERATGSNTNGGVEISPVPKEESKVKYVTHIILYADRMWTSTEGKPLQAKLIAFEDLIAEAPKGTTAPVMPQPPASPTVTRDGKVRLLVNQKPVELALDRLSRQDQEFIQQIQDAITKKAAKANQP